MSNMQRLPSQAGPFIGRARELAEISNLLSDPACRLLTLVGPGGSGKTRLAIQAASAQQASFDSGFCSVPLVQLGSKDHILPAIVSSLGLHIEAQEALQQQLLDYLHPRQLLLVLDNFEHLLDGAEPVTALLESAPQLQILTT
jgi:predicted ATPase